MKSSTTLSVLGARTGHPGRTHGSNRAFFKVFSTNSESGTKKSTTGLVARKNSQKAIFLVVGVGVLSTSSQNRIERAVT